MLIIDPNRKTYKGNTHTHTTQSDGEASYEDAIKTYADMGYDFLAITDHWRINRETRFNNMLVLSGVEYNFDIKNPALHIVGILPDGADPKVISSTRPNAAIAAINKVGGVAILAHPAWSMNTLDTLLDLGDVCAAEVFNAVSGLPWGNDRAYSMTQLDIAANHGRLFRFLTGDDTHYYTGECGKGRDMVQADELTGEGIINALRRGSFYCTQGPEIYRAEYDSLSGKYIIDCSPAKYVTFYSDAVWTANRTVTGNNITHAEYALSSKREENYIRCEVIDETGKRAWLSPVPTK